MRLAGPLYAVIASLAVTALSCQPATRTPPIAPVETAAPPVARPDPPAAPQGETPIQVEVQGAVMDPDSYSLPRGARVHDALEAAGGPSDNAELRDLNIAARLIDGSVLTVPYQARGESPTPGAADLNVPAYTRSRGQYGAAIAGDAGEGAASAARINLNRATQSELETLPGVGPKTAEKILRFRALQPFSSVDDLRYVQGIGDKRLETLRPLVTVD